MVQFRVQIVLFIMQTIKKSFTAAFINNLKFCKPRILYLDENHKSMVGASRLGIICGAKSIKYYMRLADRSYVLGDVKAYTLTEAREKLIDTYREHLENKDEFLAAKKAKSQSLTLIEVAESYFQWLKSNEKKSHKRAKSQFKFNVPHGLGDKKIHLVKRLELHSLISKKGIITPTEANRLAQLLSAIWNHGKLRMGIESLQNKENPAQKLNLFKENKGTRYLEWDEIMVFWELTKKANKPYRDLFKLFLLLGQHPYSEIGSMRSNQIKRINGDAWWMMEEGFHKSGKPHSVYLHQKVLKIIDEQPKGKYVFPCERGYPAVHYARQWNNMIKGCGLEHFTPMHMRPTVLTHLFRNGFNAALLANHSGSNITENVYVRGDDLKGKKALMTWWVEKIETLVGME